MKEEPDSENIKLRCVRRWVPHLVDLIANGCCDLNTAYQEALYQERKRACHWENGRLRDQSW